MQKKVGQIIKLNPYNWDSRDHSGLSMAPFEWGVHMSIDKKIDSKAGIWASPIISKGRLYVSSHTGVLYAVDTRNGQVLWEDNIGYHAWASPVITDNQENLLVASCQGELRNYSLTGPTPVLEWEFVIPGRPCIESTPLVLDGSIYVGTRDGYFYSIGNK